MTDSTLINGAFRILSSGTVSPVVFPDTLPLEQLAEALAALENRKTWGKAVVRIKDEERKLEAKL